MRLNHLALPPLEKLGDPRISLLGTFCRLLSLPPLHSHAPRRRSTQYSQAARESPAPVATGSSAGACPWARRRRDPGADDDTGEGWATTRRGGEETGGSSYVIVRRAMGDRP